MEYMKPLQEYRIKKLKLALSHLRNVLLKRDYQERTKDILNLEQSKDQTVWMETYKKLKIKLTGIKVEPPVKP